MAGIPYTKTLSLDDKNAYSHSRHNSSTNE